MSSNLPYSKFSEEVRERIENIGARMTKIYPAMKRITPQPLKMSNTPVVVRIRDAILVFQCTMARGTFRA